MKFSEWVRLLANAFGVEGLKRQTVEAERPRITRLGRSSLRSGFGGVGGYGAQTDGT